MALKAGAGFGPYMEHSLQLLGSRRIVQVDQPELAHADFIAHRQRGQVLDQVVLDWLAGDVFTR